MYGRSWVGDHGKPGEVAGSINLQPWMAATVEGSLLAGYRYENYRSEPSEHPLPEVVLASPLPADWMEAVERPGDGRLWPLHGTGSINLPWIKVPPTSRRSCRKWRFGDDCGDLG